MASSVVAPDSPNLSTSSENLLEEKEDNNPSPPEKDVTSPKDNDSRKETVSENSMAQEFTRQNMELEELPAKGQPIPAEVMTGDPFMGPDKPVSDGGRKRALEAPGSTDGNAKFWETISKKEEEKERKEDHSKNTTKPVVASRNAEQGNHLGAIPKITTRIVPGNKRKGKRAPEMSALMEVDNDIEYLYEEIDLTSPDEEVDTSSSLPEYVATISPTDLKVKLTKVNKSSEGKWNKNPQYVATQGEWGKKKGAEATSGYQLFNGWKFARRDEPRYQKLDFATSSTTAGAYGSTSEVTGGSLASTRASFESFAQPPLPPRGQTTTETYADLVANMGRLQSELNDERTARAIDASLGSADCMGKLWRNCGGRRRKGIPKKWNPDEEEDKRMGAAIRFGRFPCIAERNYPNQDVFNKTYWRVAPLPTPSNKLPCPGIFRQAGSPLNLTFAPVANWMLGNLVQSELDDALVVSILLKLSN